MANRLAREASPYLLEHADNPVDWFPWGPEALEKAKKEDKPILLSIGYSACHWCHVMERESFENGAIAARMNELFVNVKVDREERPDLDQIYQLVVQLMGRSGGWPLTVFLTPDQKPFFAGTYFPPSDRRGMTGFPRVIEALSDAYRLKRGEIEEQARELTDGIVRAAGNRGRGRSPEAASAPEPKVPHGLSLSDAAATSNQLLRRVSRPLLARFDAKNGGFGTRPKFPNTMSLDLLLRQGVFGRDPVCRASVELALEQMRMGGIWDQLGGGFHRYSTDERWLVPHFEKMLYDNALLLRLYADGFRALKKPLFAETARAIARYAMFEMREPGGGFYSSTDADSEGEEGKFFVWKLDELDAAVGTDREAREIARMVFGLTDEGNFEGTGATVLHENKSIEAAAAIFDLSPEAAAAALERAREKMLVARSKRPRPNRDDKVLASWNGLFIGALADAGRALDEPSFVDAAGAAFARIEKLLIRDGRVGRYVKDGVAPSAKPGFLDDQSYVGCAALDLYEATGDARYVEIAKAIAAKMIEHHEDGDAGGFFFTPDDGDALIARTKDAFDQAIPAAASMAALLCMRLGELAGAPYAAAAEKQIDALSAPAQNAPMGMGQAVLGIDRIVRGATSIVLVGARSLPSTRALADVCFHTYLPNRSVIYIDPSDPRSVAAAPVLAEGKVGREGVTVAYVCRGNACSAPVTEPEALATLLREDSA